jgi:opacity protein-like surface antigen
MLFGLRLWRMPPRLPLIIIGYSVCGLASLSAQAADLSPRMPAFAPAAFNWTGIYIGGQLGGAWTSGSWADPFSGLGTTSSATGIIGGGQIGANYQLGSSFVLGVEGDFTVMSLNNSATDASGFVNTTNLKWTSTITGRAGFAVNCVLVYGKGGVAFIGEKDTVVDPSSNTASAATERTGWTVGGGIEYAMDSHWLARVEYDYLAFGSQNISLNGPVLGAGTGSVNLNIQRALVGLNYKF